MICRGLLATCLVGMTTGCGAAPPKDAGPHTVQVGPAKSVASVSEARREPSSEIKRLWPFTKKPTIVAYADLDGLFRTEVLKGLLPSVLDIAKSSMNSAQTGCLHDALQSAKELVFGATKGDDHAFVVRLDRRSAKSTLGACLKAFGEAAPANLTGAEEAYELPNGFVIALKSGVVLGGSRTLVDAGLTGRGSPSSLSDLTLGSAQYLTWSFDAEEAGVVHGSLIMNDKHFYADADLELTSETLAQGAVRQLEKASGLSNLARSFGSKTEGTDVLERLSRAVHVKRNGRRVHAEFDLREPPVAQAHDLGAAAALAIYATRKYLVSSKQMEARNTLGQVSKDIVATWERENDGKPRGRKKLVSYPPVPKDVPRGVKYASKPGDWKTWEAIGFQMATPQYFQYEVKAAKDGGSCEVLARGDLNGDGKTSLFRVKIQVDRQTNALEVDPSIDETEPDE